ncbi:MAG: DUF6497 family protein [Pseudomonadota bacterium]
MREWVRGCGLVLLLSVAPAFAQDVPSGQSVTLSEVLVDQVGAEVWLRFRFVAPAIARDTGTLTYAEAEADFQELCDGFALPYMSDFDLTADVIVISLMDEPVPFGTSAPDATQFFEAFRPGVDGCEWEAL